MTPERARACGIAGLALLVAAFGGTPGASAQERPAEVEPADTLEQVDSARLRTLERLRDLGRGPGADSARLAADSAALADRRGGSGAEGRRDPGSVGAQDSVARALLRLEGYAPVGYGGAGAEYDGRRGELTLRGSEDERPEVSRDGMILRADSAIVYDEREERVRARGEAEYTPATGDAVESRSMVLDLRSERGSALGARTRYTEGGTDWFVQGDLPSVAGDVIHGSHTSFTSCNLEIPHYHFETDRIKIVQDRILVARPARLYFADVPVAWLPFMAQSLEQGRSSGLLTPRFSVNDIVRTSSGYDRRVSNVGFYWAMSEYSDATLALDWFSDNFISATSRIRYEWNRQFLNGNLDIRRFWRDEGGRELTFDTRHSWEISERTRFSGSARYASSTDFVRQNSFDPEEVTRDIRSEGGLDHRFGWASFSLGADRRQALTSDEVEMTLPSASLNLDPVTLFDAPPGGAAFYNNATWNGSVNMTRRLFDFGDQPLDTTFRASRADRVESRASASSSWNVGNLSLSQGMSYSSRVQQGIPEFLLDPVGDPEEDPFAGPVETLDLGREELSWNAGVSYQQRLIGSTTLSPRVRLSGRSVRSDTLSAGSGFVAAPARTSFGARLKTDVYGFYPGFATLDRIRHKVTTGVSYDYSPEVTPSDLQRQVFGSREIRPESVVRMDFNQTFEAKVAEDEDEAAAAPDTAAETDTVEAAGPGAEEEEEEAEIVPGGEEEQIPGQEAGGLEDSDLERVETGRTVTLLALNTSAVTYDFVQADSIGNRLAGFTRGSTRLTNTVRSDYLQGLSLQFSHDLFEDPAPGDDGPGGEDPLTRRRFAPHLASMNFSFSLSSSSSVFRSLGLFGADEEDEEPDATQEEPFRPEEERQDERQEMDEGTVVPGTGGGADRADGDGGRVGRWSANFSYALDRPRDPRRESTQTLQMNYRFRPTEKWDVSWRTSYDLERGGFNDHSVRLTRDLHRWEANFDFRQTATGNWSFRFEVVLLDNRDLKFDHQQRSRTGGRRPFRR